MAELTSNQLALVRLMTKGPLHEARGFELISKQPKAKDFFSALKDEGFFHASRNPVPQPAPTEGYYQIPYWPALTYLLALAKIAGATGDALVGSELMTLVREISNYKTPSGDNIDNYHTFRVLAEILGLLPTSCITEADIDLIRRWLASRWGNSGVVIEVDGKLLPALIASSNPSDEPKAVQLLGVVTELRVATEDGTDITKKLPVADAFWLEKLLKHRSADLGLKIGHPAVACLRARAAELFDEAVITDHTWLRRAAIEPNEQNHDWDHVTNAFVEGLRDSWISWTGTSPTVAADFTISALEDPSQIIRRVAIFVVRTYWLALGEKFLLHLTPKMFDIGHLHELFDLLRDHYAQLSPESRAKVLVTIGLLTKPHVDGSEEFVRAERQQQNWLEALQGRGDVAADREYARLSEKLGVQRDNPSFLSYHTSWVGSGPSPFSQDELSIFAERGMLTDKVEGFIPASREIHSPMRSLLDNVSEATAKAPSPFVRALLTESRMTRRLQYSILEGVRRAFGSAKDRSTSKAVHDSDLWSSMDFVANLFARRSFWEEDSPKSQDLEPTKDWIPGSIADLIKEIAADDGRSLSDDQLRLLWKIVGFALANLDGIDSSDDALTAAINNSRGKSVEAMLSLALRGCRDADKQVGEHATFWSSISPDVDSELQLTRNSHFETSAIVATYLAQLIYVDSVWVRARIGDIFPFEHRSNLVSALSGLSFANMSKPVYEALLVGDVVRRALQIRDLQKTVRERIVERVALAYIWDIEKQDSLVFAEMFVEDRLDDLVELATTVASWTDENLTPDQILLAKSLGKRLTVFGFADPVNRSKLLAATAEFIGFAGEVTDDDMGWLLETVPFSAQSPGAYKVAPALDRLASSDPARSMILLSAFLSRRQPSYDYDNALRSAIGKIHAAGYHVEAFKLVDLLVRAGLSGFQELYQDMATGS